MTLFFSCEHESEDYTVGDDITNISLYMSFSDISFETDYRPVHSKSSLPVLSVVNNVYKIIVIKKINHQWVVDSVLNCRINSEDYPLNSYDLTSKLKLFQTLELRPGIYKIAVFLNAIATKWNNELKTGTIVSDNDEINPLSDLPPALSYYKYSVPNSNDSLFLLSREIFAGYTEFEIDKKQFLESEKNPINKTIMLERKVASLRLLLEYDTETPISLTQHYFKGKLISEKKFPQGLNILGGSWVSDTAKNYFQFYISASPPPAVSSFDNKMYYFSRRDATYFFPYIFINDTMNCRMTELQVFGQAGGYMYTYSNDVPLSLFKNKMTAISFSPTVNTFDWDNGICGVYLRHNMIPDPNTLFPPYAEWN